MDDLGWVMRLALIGDVHTCWDDTDVEQIDALGYDLVCFVGDLPDPLHRGMHEVARSIARLRTPALVFPGNHDGPSPTGVLREALGLLWHPPGSTRRALHRLDRLQEALGPVPLVGYSLHPFPAHDVSIVAARPFSMGGPRASFPGLLAARHGTRSLRGSTDRLIGLLAEAPGRILVLAHNGPSGLGGERHDPFSLHGRRDLGDDDLAQALAWARRHERPVLGVLAGHMHHDGASRRWKVEHDGLLVINGARVPRIDHHTGHERRHHVEVRVEDGGVSAREVTLIGATAAPPR
jgi:uncharacterized protein (TIGR04168 family)